MNILRVSEQIREKEFPKYIAERGYKCIRLNMSNLNRIKKIFDKKEINNWVWKGINFGAGMPDFFIYNDNHYYFCEFKSENDVISIAQINWFDNHKRLSLMLAVVVLNINKKIKLEDWIKVEKKHIKEIQKEILERKREIQKRNLEKERQIEKLKDTNIEHYNFFKENYKIVKGEFVVKKNSQMDKFNKALKLATKWFCEKNNLSRECKLDILKYCLENEK